MAGPSGPGTQARQAEGRARGEGDQAQGGAQAAQARHAKAEGGPQGRARRRTRSTLGVMFVARGINHSCGYGFRGRHSATC